MLFNRWEVVAITLPLLHFMNLIHPKTLYTLKINKLQMKEVIANLNNAEIIKGVGGTLATGVGALLTWYFKRRSVRRKKDLRQDELIQMLLAQTEQLARSTQDTIGKMDSKLDELMVKINKFETRANRSDELAKFSERIMEIGYGLITTYELNPALSGMIIEGCKSVATIFSEVLAKDVKKADVSRINLNALAAMRNIRETYRNHHLISEDAAYAIKHEVAKPLLTGLLSEIHLITTGQFNGKSEEHFKEAVLTFVKDFIKQSIGHAVK